MKKVLAVAALLLAASPSFGQAAKEKAAAGKSTGASPKEDIKSELDIRKLYEEFQANWNKHDAKALAKHWSVDGDHVDPDGRVAKGRPEVEKLFEAEHQTVFKDSHLALNVDSVWFVTADVALVDATYDLSGAKDPDGKDIPARKGHSSSVMLKEGPKWTIAASRLMIPVPQLPWRKAEAGKMEAGKPEEKK